MVSEPLVSIVTPSYNQAQYLPQTIESVLGQDYPRLEYCVVDGGSTDGSPDIIRRYAKDLSWWVSEKDSGQAEAINKGLSRSRGDIVAWLNSDDLYRPGAIRAAVAVFQAHPECGLVYSDMLAINGAGETINLIRYGQWSLEDLLQFEILGQPAVFMRRDVLEKSGLLDTRFHMLLDHQLWIRMASFAPMFHSDQVWAAARFHELAKNLATPSAFGVEAYRIVDWLQQEATFQPYYRRLRRKIWAGAHRMNGRYLLDEGRVWDSLRAYAFSLRNYFPIGIREYRRIIFALFSLVFNVDFLRSRYLAARKTKINH